MRMRASYDVSCGRGASYTSSARARCEGGGNADGAHMSPKQHHLYLHEGHSRVHRKRMASKRTKVFKLRLKPREWTEWKMAAKRSDKTLSEWVRVAVEAWVRNEEPRER